MIAATTSSETVTLAARGPDLDELNTDGSSPLGENTCLTLVEDVTLFGGSRQMRKLLIGVAVVMSWVVAMSASAQTVDKKTRSFEAATKIATKAAEEARARGVGVVIAVVDDGGHLILLHRLNDTQVASVNVGIGKARTAAIYRRPSRDFEEQIRAGRVAALALA